MVSQSLILGYHGCDRSVAEKVVAGREKLWRSERPWDWLGHGIYFWEDSPSRALRWAEDEARKRNGRISTPAVIGAVINLGNCLNLIDAEALTLVRTAHEAYQAICCSSGAQPARNHGVEMKQRDLDCAVIETLHQLREAQGLAPFDTVRGFFVEGRELYPGAGFRELDHIQVCVRTPSRILGYFHPLAA